ncbi:hypothetical protein RYB69_06240 [Pseudomonas syringae]|uniref:hypothetical protein n=1 Tax=Pseudomonas syringae TaxID=317 RepID=UPI00200AC5EF|nr:hypothetical protein [Pseudomonas syringae]MCK9744207.1 hypothetical protein [Pseudomonas syringae pv. syringae]MCK9769684.1 hypothetical protein [Pseudomonas syringae pv. syringae]MDU8600637.1 hypothetical protein [Pseudomonas syringae]
MNVMFGFKKSAKFDAALNKTFERFEGMSGAQIMALGAEHADGQLATLLSGESQSDSIAVHELSFVFDSPVADLKSFIASFESRSVVSFKTGWQSTRLCARTEAPYDQFNSDCALIGAVAFSAIPGALCIAA